GLRLGGFALAMPVLDSVEGLDGTAFAATVGLGVVALLAAEVRLVLRRPKLWWVSPDRAPTRLEKAMRDMGRPGDGPQARRMGRIPATSDGKESA
ncbi:MAG: hypothetical protein M3252_02640, partial [Actinomycetota bacterium]|nr:hypothetical protein [Actinomycetota bacterium]